MADAVENGLGLESLLRFGLQLAIGISYWFSLLIYSPFSPTKPKFVIIDKLVAPFAPDFGYSGGLAGGLI